MTDKETKLVENFLNRRFNNLILTEFKNGKYKTLKIKNSKKNIFIYEEKHEMIFCNSEIVIDPILKMFKTDYSETYDFVKEWVKCKFDIDCIDIVGFIITE
jgi:hypothetical protein